MTTKSEPLFQSWDAMLFQGRRGEGRKVDHLFIQRNGASGEPAKSCTISLGGEELHRRISLTVDRNAAFNLIKWLVVAYGFNMPSLFDNEEVQTEEKEDLNCVLLYEVLVRRDEDGEEALSHTFASESEACESADRLIDRGAYEARAREKESGKTIYKVGR